MISRSIWMLLLVVALAAGCGTGPASSRPAAANPRVDFVQDIQPILEASCIQCHGRGKNKGGLSLETREALLRGGESGPAIVVGKGKESLLVQLVSGQDPDRVMPQKGTALTEKQTGLLRAWIDQGAAWDASITFARPAPKNLTPRLVTLPPGPGNPVDRLLARYFAAHHFAPPKPVDDRTFARRAYLDVVGLLPPADELAAFLQDTRPDKRSALVEKLLADDAAYAAHWLTFWNDLLRNDYRGTGYIDGGRKQITPWLYSALLTNMPYDRFVAQLVNPTPDTEGFTRGIVWRGVVNASQSPPMQAAQNVAQVFMGVNLKCASCHDSFINDWKLADAYGLASLYSDQPLEMVHCDKPTGEKAQPRFIYAEVGEINAGASRSERLQQLAAVMTGPADCRLPSTIVNRLWQRCFGRGLVEPVDDMEQPAWNQDLLDWLAADLVAGGYDLKKTLHRILTSEAYSLPAVNLGETMQKQFVFRGPGVRRLSAEQFRDALARITGIWPEHSEVPGVARVRAAHVPADPLTVALGRPNREQVLTSRAYTATTLQALELTNGGTLADLLHRAAPELIRLYPKTPNLIESVYAAALGRPPTATERELATQLLTDPPQPAGVEDLLWAIAVLPEFQLIY